MCISSMLEFSAFLLPKTEETLTDSSLRPHLYSTCNECVPKQQTKAKWPQQAIWSFSVRCHFSVAQKHLQRNSSEACQHRPPIRHFPTDRSSLPDLSPASKAWSNSAITNAYKTMSQKWIRKGSDSDLVQGQILANELGSGLQRSTQHVEPVELCKLSKSNLPWCALRHSCT